MSYRVLKGDGNMLKFSVNNKRCTRCGLCAMDCPTRIIEQKGDALPQIRPDREASCMQCQHCLAVCPTAAISILGRNPDHSFKLSPNDLPSLEQMTRLVRGRRSIRHYKDENVSPALIRQLLDTLANTPTGVNRRELTFSLIGDKTVMHRLRVKVLESLKTAGGKGRIPERFSYLHDAAAAFFEHKTDIIFRTAPHALIVSAPPDAPCPEQDVALALAYFELLAQSAGLGTCWWGMFNMVMETLPELKPLAGLPADHVYCAMLFGTPAISFSRTVQRDDAAVIRDVNL
jgi:nitroreductase/NAD-dependent dihydropyrimidine dehydrogenase PreA subunit